MVVDLPAKNVPSMSTIASNRFVIPAMMTLGVCAWANRFFGSDRSFERGITGRINLEPKYLARLIAPAIVKAVDCSTVH